MGSSVLNNKELGAQKLRESVYLRRGAGTFSTGLAGEIIESFEGEVNLIKNPHRQAGFRVLQSADLPSALVELGYLSNPEDEKLLTDEAWRQSTAALLAQSISAYRETILAAGKR